MIASPEQIEAAMPAMREWWLVHGGWSRVLVDRLADGEICMRIASHYPGGVAQFIKDQEERRG